MFDLLAADVHGFAFKDGGKDEFYILSLRDLQNHFARTYKGGRRPKKPESMHCTILPKEIGKFRDNWGLVEGTVAALRQAKRKR